MFTQDTFAYTVHTLSGRYAGINYCTFYRYPAVTVLRHLGCDGMYR